jgi:hypothetical protein
LNEQARFDNQGLGRFIPSCMQSWTPHPCCLSLCTSRSAGKRIADESCLVHVREVHPASELQGSSRVPYHALPNPSARLPY